MHPDEHSRFLFERADEPQEFDPRGCRSVFAMLAAFWLAVFFIIAWALDWSPWDALWGVV